MVQTGCAIRDRLVNVASSFTIGCGRVILATVNVERASASFILTERGTTDAGGVPIATHNATRWTFADREIVIEHVRFGIKRPVFLVRLSVRDDGTWQAAEAHVCGRDRYDATLRVEGEKLVLTWCVSGPRKGYALTTVYLPSPAI